MDPVMLTPVDSELDGMVRIPGFVLDGVDPPDRPRRSGDRVCRRDVAFDVPVNNALVVRDFESVGNLASYTHCFVLGERIPALDAIRQTLSFHERHHVEGEPVQLPGVDQRQDVRVLETCDEPDLLEESLRTRARRDRGHEHLDRDRTSVLEILGRIHDGHPAALRSLRRVRSARRKIP
jgi:hypothetical protein